MINLTIDNKQIEVPQGATILEAARRAGAYVPTLCHVKNLKPFGACRICLVAVAKMPKLVTACTTPVTPGMVVETDTPEIHRQRRFVVEMMLSDHDFRCGVCEASGDCSLQELAYRYGLQGEAYRGEKRSYARDEANPYLERDHSRCILCGACVRVCDEVQGEAAIDFARRGFVTKISPAYDKALNCSFCGQCMNACPTGAISSKPARHEGRAWEFETTRSVCTYCGCGCNINLQTKDGRLIRVSPVADTPVNQGHICAKGSFGYDFVQHPDRLTTPLIKENGQFREATWDEALSLAARRLGEIKAKYGSDAIGGLASARSTNEENYVFQKFMRAAIGTNNVDHTARMRHASPTESLADVFGAEAMTNSISDIAEAEVIFTIGFDAAAMNPIIGLEVLKAVRSKGAKLIVADPRPTRLSGYAQVWLRQMPGSDVAMLNGLANVILAEGLENKEFIGARTEGFDEFRKAMAEYTPERVEQITGIPADNIREAARLYAKAGKAAILYSMAAVKHAAGVDYVRAIANLALLTGNIGRPGTGVNPMRGRNNVQGVCDMGGMPDVYPGYQKVTDPAVRQKFEAAWGVALSDKPGLTAAEMLAAAGSKIKAMYIMGETPSSPDLQGLEPQLRNLEFLVVQDMFLTETAKLADVVLPVAAFAEKYGTFTNTERRVQRVREAVAPPGQAKVDREVICELSQRLGYSMHYNNEAQIMYEIAKLTPIYGGITPYHLEENGLQWPCPDENHPGTPILHSDKFSRGLGKFTPVEFKS